MKIKSLKFTKLKGAVYIVLASFLVSIPLPVCAARALEWLISKRKPLTIVNRGDGTYCVFDGNNTYSASH